MYSPNRRSLLDIGHPHCSPYRLVLCPRFPAIFTKSSVYLMGGPATNCDLLYVARVRGSSIPTVVCCLLNVLCPLPIEQRNYLGYVCGLRSPRTEILMSKTTISRMCPTGQIWHKTILMTCSKIHFDSLS